MRLASSLPLRAGHRPARRLPGRARQGSARRRWSSTTSPPPSPQGIEELTRPIDAIKHQAKTVTVGISRTDETLLQAPLVQAVLAAGAPRDRLSYQTLRTLADLDPAVAEVTGWIRYEIDGDAGGRRGAGVVVDRGGIALDIPSRTERDRRAAGHQAHASPSSARCSSPGAARTAAPSSSCPRPRTTAPPGSRCCTCASTTACPWPPRAVRCRATATAGRRLRDAVLETEPTFREDLLAEMPTADLLVEPIRELADRWRSARDDRDRRRPLSRSTGCATALGRTPTLRDRVFTDDEQAYCDRRKDPTERYAARFAAKEAVLKAHGRRPRRLQVARDRGGQGADSGAPSVRAARRRAASLADGAGHPRAGGSTITHTAPASPKPSPSRCA